MVTQISKGIKISVDARYQENSSSPEKNNYIFSYHISIRNDSDFPVQLLRRRWLIFDSVFQFHEVEGEGVIGQQPVILPSQQYEYESFCQLQSDMGSMKGSYLMQRLSDELLFEVEIPAFQLIHPARLN
jgi:ApaG protein